MLFLLFSSSLQCCSFTHSHASTMFTNNAIKCKIVESRYSTLIDCNPPQCLMGGWWGTYSFRCQPVDHGTTGQAMRVSVVEDTPTPRITHPHPVQGTAEIYFYPPESKLLPTKLLQASPRRLFRPLCPSLTLAPPNVNRAL